MSDPQPDRPNSSGFFDALNKSKLAVSKKAAGAGVVGLLGAFAFLGIAAGLAPEAGVGLPVGSAIRSQLDLHFQVLRDIVDVIR